MNRISHWIDGKVVDGHVRAHRASSGTRPRASRRPRSTWPRPRRSTPRSPWPRRRSRRGGPRTCRAGPRSCSTCASWSTPTARRSPRCCRPSTARCSSRRAGRGGPRPGEHRVRLRHPAPAEGRLQRAGVHRRRRVHRSSSRSASWPASRRSTSRRWCRCGCSPTPSRAATRSCSSRARRTRRRRMFLAELLKQAGLPDGCFNVVNGDKEAVDAHPRPPRHRRRSASSAPRRSPSYIYETGTRNGKRVQALGGAKNHMLVLPDADLDMAADAARQRRPTARPASGAWPSRSCSPSTRSPTRWSTRSASASRRSRSARPASRTTRWAR